MYSVNCGQKEKKSDRALLALAGETFSSGSLSSSVFLKAPSLRSAPEQDEEDNMQEHQATGNINFHTQM